MQRKNKINLTKATSRRKNDARSNTIQSFSTSSQIRPSSSSKHKLIPKGKPEQNSFKNCEDDTF